MKDCVAQAHKHCNVQDKDGGYVILGGRSQTVMMGSKDGQYQKASEVAQLEVRCGLEELEDEAPEESSTLKLPPRTDAEVAPTDLPQAPAPVVVAPSAAVCTKGATQACVGPGACQGGQVCLSDGSGFGPCDCGTESARSPSTVEKNLTESPPVSPPETKGGSPSPLN